VVAYGSTCAVTGLRLINGGRRCEVEAAHIPPVGDGHCGPDSVRNGIALSRTVRLMFGRGLLTVTDDYEIVIAKRLMSDDTRRLIKHNRRILDGMNVTLICIRGRQLLPETGAGCGNTARPALWRECAAMRIPTPTAMENLQKKCQTCNSKQREL